MLKFNTVKEYFEEKFPLLVSDLENNQSHFWRRVNDNTIPSDELIKNVAVDVMIGNYQSFVFLASVAILFGRKQGMIADPL